MTDETSGPANSAAAVKSAANKDWLRALQRIAPIEQDQSHILSAAFDEVVAARGPEVAVIDDRESLSFTQFAERANRYSRWALDDQLQKGDVVALLMGNCADYAAIWLGLTRVGVVVALLNTHLSALALAHCLRVAGARSAIVSDALAPACREAAAMLDTSIRVLVHDGERFVGGLKADVAGLSGAPLADEERREVTLGDRALYIFTSGTTGLPKAAIVIHRKLMNWSLWFSGLTNAGPNDRMYNCLPMYHSVGGVVAVWSVLLAGGSASSFWDDMATSRCTMFQYIGELCRYLLNAPDCEAARRHGLRLVVGNGLRADVWTRFQRRFDIPRILEFYAATESNFSLYNVEGEPGAIGRVPAFLAHRLQIALVAIDEATRAPARGTDGFCIRLGVGEPGEAVARIEARESSSASFDGYVSPEDSDRKVLRDVFEPGDAWMRSGDLMRKDARGYFYFSDRLGDSFRWKGENVSSFEVAQVLAACPGVRDANVYGVEVPGFDGRAGMAALAVGDDFDLDRLRQSVDAALPSYARPLFLRLCETLETTETFKHKKQALAAQGFEAEGIGGALYFARPGVSSYVPLDAAMRRRICAGEFRL